MKIKHLAIFTLLISGASVAADKKGVEFLVSLSPAGSFTAQSNAISGQANVRKSGLVVVRNAEVPVKSFKTGITLRDDHMNNNYFEAAKFPKITMLHALGKKGKFKGKIKCHGVVKVVEGTYGFKGRLLVAKFKTTLSDYGIKEVSWKGIGVDDEIEVEVTLPWARKEAAKNEKDVDPELV
jgi:polyisoprenoid-binding protein YceI